jgi:hypothetical protein
MSGSFTEVVHAALGDALKEPTPKLMADALPRLIRERLRVAGYEIHATGTCVRPKLRRGESAEFGREMTASERETLGVDQ